jgi:tetratricopeptide (TPR) repeat protein
LAEYRQGHFGKALELALDVMAETNRPGRVESLEYEGAARVEACAVAAMAQHRLGNTAKAHFWLAKAMAGAENSLPPPATAWFSWKFYDWLVPHVLVREARELVQGRAPSNGHEDLAELLRGYAAANARRGNLASAEVFLRSALSLYRKGPECDGPGLADTLGRLSAVLGSQGKKAEGEGLAREAAEALTWYRKAGGTADARAENYLAWLLATSAIPELRDGTGAIALAEKTVAATSRKDPSFLDTLAAAYAEAGQFEKAVATQKEAIALVTTDKEKKDLANRLKLYESNRPCREP